MKQAAGAGAGAGAALVESSEGYLLCPYLSEGGHQCVDCQGTWRLDGRMRERSANTMNGAVIGNWDIIVGRASNGVPLDWVKEPI